MKNYVGATVQCTRDGATGTVAEQDSLTITIEVNGKNKAYTHNTFNRWWKVLVAPEEPKPEKTRPPIDSKVDSWGRPAGDYGIGVKLRDKFISIVKDYDFENVVIFHDEKKKKDTVRYLGKIIFETSYADRRFNVYCRYESLTPMNKNKLAKLCPKEWCWTLRAKFVFTDMSQWPLMKSIINDGFFYENNRGKE